MFSLSYNSGSQDVAGDLAILEGEGITHIVNCATGVPNYYPKKFTYLHLEVLDLPCTDIIRCFREVHDFMKACVDSGGKVSNLSYRFLWVFSSFLRTYALVISGFRPLQCWHISCGDFCDLLFDGTP